MRSGPFEDPVEIARSEAGASGVCPSCVGDPMDDCFEQDDGWRPPRPHETEPEELGIPF